MRTRYARCVLGAVEGYVVNNHLVFRRVGVCLSLGVLGVLLGACQGPSEPGPQATEAEASRATATPRPAANAESVKMTRDQRVAALRKTLARPLSRSPEGLNVETLPNGKRAVHLDGRFSHATILRIKPDGTREHGCFDDADHAVEFATGDEARP